MKKTKFKIKGKINKTEKRKDIMVKTKAEFEKINLIAKEVLSNIRSYIEVIGEPDTLILKDIYKDAGVIIPATESLIENIDKTCDNLVRGIKGE